MCAKLYIRPLFKNALCGFRSAHSFSEFLRSIGISGKNFRSIGHLEVPDLASLIFNEEFNGIWYKKLTWQSWCTLFKVVVGNGSVLGSLHLRVPYRTNRRQWGLLRSLQERPKGPKTGKLVIFRGDGSLDSLFTRLWERLKLLWTSHMSGYLMEPIRDN